MANPYSIVIPARMASSRFPGKPLHEINGKPMLAHVVDRARESNATTIVVATDSQQIVDCCHDIRVDVEMTDAAHVSGTDRIAEVATRLNWSEDTIIVGLQGDEPATEPSHLDQLASNLAESPTANMATYAIPLHSLDDFNNPDRVKVVLDANNLALYFSRASIPHYRDTEALQGETPAFIHVGLYAYRCGYLRQFAQTPPAPLEVTEQLEQLRVLYNGGRIHVGVLKQAVASGVDRIEDVSAVAELLAQKFK